MVRFQYRSLVTLFLIGVFIYVVIGVWDRPIQARLFPWTIGFLALALLAFQLYRELRPQERKGGQETGVDLDFTEEESSGAGRRRALELFVWIYGFVLLIWFVGFLVAIPAMILAYLLRQRENRVLVVAMPAAALLITWGIFDQLLNLPFPPGALFEWLGWAS